MHTLWIETLSSRQSGLLPVMTITLCHKSLLRPWASQADVPTVCHSVRKPRGWNHCLDDATTFAPSTDTSTHCSSKPASSWHRWKVELRVRVEARNATKMKTVELAQTRSSQQSTLHVLRELEARNQVALLQNHSSHQVADRGDRQISSVRLSLTLNLLNQLPGTSTRVKLVNPRSLNTGLDCICRPATHARYSRKRPLGSGRTTWSLCTGPLMHTTASRSTWTRRALKPGDKTSEATKLPIQNPITSPKMRTSSKVDVEQRQWRSGAPPKEYRSSRKNSKRTCGLHIRLNHKALEPLSQRVKSDIYIYTYIYI